MRKKLRNKLTVDRSQLTVDSRQLTKRPENVFVVLLMVIAMVMGCTRNEQAHEHDVFTCPMHPTVVSDRPGACPVCGMDLVRKARPGEEVKITEDLAKILRSPNGIVAASIKTIRGEYKSMPVAVHAQGMVTYDTRAVHAISARVAGRLEKIYLKYEFQPVSKGQKIAEIYSPELVTAQREFVFLLQNDSDNEILADASARKLELMGMSAGQINELLRTKRAQLSISVYSDHSGYLITQQQAPTAPVAMPTPQSAGAGMRDGMGGGQPSGSVATPQIQSNASTGIAIREGDYVAAGQTLFTVASASALRVELNVPGTYAGAIEKGGKVILDFGDGEKEATVDFIQPFFTEGQEFIKVRVYTSRNEGLQIGRLVNAQMRLTNTASLWVPREAVLDLGNQKVVFVKDRGVLKPKEVIAGMTTEGMTEITGGLASADEIAANAQFLIDSESFIKPAE